MADKSVSGWPARMFQLRTPGNVERTAGHRYDRCQVFCSRCGIHVSQAEIKKCMPSNVEVLVRP